jgi:hypothetical protein
MRTPGSAGTHPPVVLEQPQVVVREPEPVLAPA